MSAGLLTTALILAAPVGAAPTGLQKGDEFTFVGSVAEVNNRPGQEFRRNHSLELRVLVLERQEHWADVAVLTKLRRLEDAVSGAAGEVTGTAPDKNAPPVVRLDLVRVHTDGTVHLITPPGPPPLRLTADVPARARPPIPLDVFASSEFGVFPPRVPRDAAKDPWTVAAGPTRPSETWQAQKFEFVNAEQCQLLVMNQQSPDWNKPIGGEKSWHRAEAVWVSTQDGTARKVHRVIRHRDGRADKLAAWIEVKYELKDQAKLSGRTYDRSRRDVDVAFTALTDAALLVPEATRVGTKIFEAKLAKLDAYLNDNDPGSPYREAIVAARRTLESASRGKATVSLPTPISSIPAVAPRSRWPEAGQLAPELRLDNFKLSEQRGKPVVLVFFKPGGETTDLSLAIADALDRRYGGRVLVVPLVVYGDVPAAISARDRLKLKIPLRDGSSTIAGYGVETVPRFAVIDEAGKVRWEFTGVGSETGFLLREQVDRLSPPIAPISASGTTPTSGPRTRPPMPRP